MGVAAFAKVPRAVSVEAGLPDVRKKKMTETDTSPWFLFLGGPSDGEHTAVESNKQFVLIETARFNPYLSVLPTDKVDVAYKEHTYRKVYLHCEGATYAVYVHSSVLAPLGELIRGYKP